MKIRNTKIYPMRISLKRCHNMNFATTHHKHNLNIILLNSQRKSICKEDRKIANETQMLFGIFKMISSQLLNIVDIRTLSLHLEELSLRTKTSCLVVSLVVWKKPARQKVGTYPKSRNSESSCKNAGLYGPFQSRGEIQIEYRFISKPVSPGNWQVLSCQR